MASMNSLPNELLLLIVDHAVDVPLSRNQSALKSLSVVSRAFRQPAQAALFSSFPVIVRSLDHAEALMANEELLQLAITTKSLNLAASFDTSNSANLARQFTTFARLARRFDYVTELNINVVTLPLDPEHDSDLPGFDEALGNLFFAQLADLEVRIEKEHGTTDVIVPILSRTPRLCSLTLAGSGNLDNRMQERTDVRLPCLERVDTSRFKDEPTSSLASICNHLTDDVLEQVTTARVRSVMNVFDENGGRYLMPKLRNLAINVSWVSFENEELDSFFVWRVWFEQLNVTYLSLWKAKLSLTLRQMLRIVPESVEHVCFAAKPSTVWNVDSFDELTRLVATKSLKTIEVYYVNTRQPRQDFSEVVRRQGAAALLLAGSNIQLLVKEAQDDLIATPAVSDYDD